jgi:hypothetical protein
MKTVLCQLALTLALISLAEAQEQEAPGMPTWEEKIAKGLVPYHQLTVEDFKIDDQAHPEASFWVRPFMHPHWQYVMKWKDGWHYAYIVQWIVFSGFDKNDSSRKSKFKQMKRSLPFAQAFLDLNEIHARQLAALLPGELPSGRGATQEEARVALQKNLEAFLKEKNQPLLTETEAFLKATNRGANEKKVLELGKAIRKRLDAIPVPAKSPSNSTLATPTASPTPQPTASPAPSIHK